MGKSKDQLSPDAQARVEACMKKVKVLTKHLQMVSEFMLAQKNDPDRYGDAMQNILDEISETIAEALGPEAGQVFLEDVRYLDEQDNEPES